MKYKYVGAGRWIRGIPARDLDEEEAAQYRKQIRATVNWEQVFEEVKAPAPKTEAKPEKTKGND